MDTLVLTVIPTQAGQKPPCRYRDRVAQRQKIEKNSPLGSNQYPSFGVQKSPFGGLALNTSIWGSPEAPERTPSSPYVKLTLGSRVKPSIFKKSTGPLSTARYQGLPEHTPTLGPIMLRDHSMSSAWLTRPRVSRWNRPYLEDLWEWDDWGVQGSRLRSLTSSHS